LVPHLVEIEAPILLMVGSGRRGGGIPHEEMTLMRGSLRSLEVDTLPGAGLYLQEERPQAVADGVQRLSALR